MRLRKRLLFGLVALLGAAVAVLPALAASSVVKLEVNENCVAKYWPCWTSSSGSYPPPASVTTIAEGGVVTFVDNTSVAVNLVFSGAAPTCSAGVPVSPTPAKTGWEGTCKFEHAGHYKFESATLFNGGPGENYTKYEIVVEAAATGATPTGTGTTTTGTTTTGSSGSSTTSSGSGSPAQGGAPAAGGTPLGSLLAGGESSAITLGATQHGASVHGSIDVSQAAAGGRLEVELLARSASLAGAGHSAHVQVGRLVRSSLHAGTLTFTVSLDAKARHALRVHGRLALSVKIALAAAQGAPLTITRSVVVRG
ncbi:MAG: hypothetical protein ABSG93_02780 [Solirubrobacteraceae bacterium]|jgi:hypothetical protein